MKLRNKKTGKIQEIVVMPVIGGYPDESVLVDGETSLKEFNKIWEDYEPIKPLIEDEKIRKAVRAWAEVTVDKEDLVVAKNMEYHDYCIYTDNLSNTALIDFGIDLQIQEGSYTLNELCGEEEE